MASILVVDDEPAIRRLLRITIGPEHHVQEAEDGDAAIRRLLEQHADLALLDVAMPVMDGLAVCRAARAEPSLAHLGVIVISAGGNAEASFAAGADRHLQKPFSPLELLAAIDDVLERRRNGGPSPD